jgi:excisionase family DNA binding protein
MLAPSRNVPLAAVAERLGCSRQTVIRLITDGRLVAYRYARDGRAPLWVAEDSVETFLAECRVFPGDIEFAEELA